MRHRDAGGGGDRDRTGHAGNDFDVHAGSNAGGGLFRSTAEDERIAALEPHHTSTGGRAFDDQIVDLLLGQRVCVRRLARVDDLDIVSEGGEQLAWGEPVHHDDVGAREQLTTARCNQPGVAGSATDECDMSMRCRRTAVLPHR